jgi:hypothetical protein
MSTRGTIWNKLKNLSLRLDANFLFVHPTR